jgi:hypothetical protein
MRIWMLAAGVAALAITSPTLAQRGDQGGKGRSAQKVEKAERGGQAKANRGANRQVRAERAGGDRARSQPQRFTQREERGRDRARANAQENRERGPGRVREARADDDRGRGRGQDDVRVLKTDRDAFRGRDSARFADGDRIIRVRDIDRRGVVRVRNIDRDDLFVRRLGYGVGGCPPGLAKKPVACMPPGQAAKLVGSPLSRVARIAALDPLPNAFRPLFLDDDDFYYRYGGGYLYRVDRDNDLIDGLIPLFGAALIGQPLASSFVNPYTPSYFNSFYPNSPYDCHRYGYGYVYETDCMTGMVEDVIPTYDYGYGVGQILPASYGYYNVPYAYRSSFFDGDDYYYRYAPGAIYRVDRDTALITSVAALLTGGLTVGQPLPVGYSAYNVPYAYRTTYYDRPDMWYRYNNGYIYSVDPTTQLVTAIVRALV